VRKHETVKFTEFDISVKQWPGVVVPYAKRRGKTLEQVAYNYWPVDLEKYKIEELENGWVKVLSPRKASLYEERFYYFLELLKANKEPVNSIYHFLFAKHDIDGGERAQNYLKKINKVLENEKLEKSLPYEPYKRWHTTRGYREGKWQWSYTDPQGNPVTLEISSAGINTINIWMGEDGTRFDQIVLTQDPEYVPSVEGLKEEKEDVILVEAEEFEKNVERLGIQWKVLQDKEGFIGKGFVYAAPDTGTIIDQEIEKVAPELTYRVNFQRPGKYYLWIRENSDTKYSDRIYIGLNGKKIVTVDFSVVIKS
jgi:hypothetical protein